MRSRKVIRLRLWIVAVVIVSCFLVFGAAACGPSLPVHPTDAELEQRFAQHPADFEELVRMSDEDSKVVRITSEFTELVDNNRWPRPEPEWGISRERWDRYRELFARLSLKNGLLRLSGTGKIELFASMTGLATGGTAKGYMHSQDDVAPIVSSLDGIEKTAGRGNTYKKLKDHWYIFYSTD